MPHHLQLLVFLKHGCLVSLTKLFGQSLILRNIEILRRIYDIDILEEQPLIVDEKIWIVTLVG